MKKIKQINFKELFDKFKQFFKYKGHIDMPIENKYKDRLLKSAVESVGVIDYDSDTKECITRSNQRYRVFKVSFNSPNGMDKDIDLMNLEGLIQTLDSLEMNFKIIFLNEMKYSLDDNIDFYKKCIEQNNDPKIKNQIQHQIDIMKVFNDSKYVSEILYIEHDDVDRFLKIITGICTVEDYNYEDNVRLFELLNNDIC